MDEQELLKRLREAFQEESTERLTTITAKLVELEHSSGDSRQTILEDIYREAHSLKGAARAVNLISIENICQAIESVFGALKSGQIGLKTDLFDILHQAVESIETLLTVDRQEDDPETERLISEILSLHSAGQSGIGALSTPKEDQIDEEPAPLADDVIEAAVLNLPIADSEDPGIEQSSTSSPMVRQELVEPDVSEKNLSPIQDGMDDKLEEPESGDKSVSPVLPKEENIPVPQNETSTEKVAQGETADLQKSKSAPRIDKVNRSTTVRISTEKLDLLLRKVEEMIALKLVAEEQYRSTLQLKSAWNTMQASWGAHKENESVDRFLSLGKEGLSNLKQGFEELLKSADQSKRTVANMVDDLLDDMKTITMLPFTTLTDMFPRMVRDISRQQGKEIELRMVGTDIEIDRRILEEMKDPLVHLVRNGIDHGIESKEERLNNSKPKRARLSLEIHQREGGKVELFFSDDGKGMDPEKLKETALQKGLITRQEAQTLTEQQCYELIFQSGMTTSSILTEISGRGLGMAIVQEKIEQLGGTIVLYSKKNFGTSFEIHLPVSLATFRGVLVVVNDRKFMLSSNLVDTVAKVHQSDLNTIENKTTIPFGNKSLPIVDLGAILNINTSPPDFEGKDLKIVVLGSGEKRIGFRVDDVVAEQEILVKGLGKQLVRVRHLAGATILGSGEIVPVLNVRDLMISASQSGNSLLVGKTRTDAGKSEQKSILVAEDSITSRMLLRSILEGAGYKVTAAVDGLDALNRLKSNPVDLIVSDVEMPRMTGFELSSQVRQDEHLKEIPLVLCTSLASQEDKERGIEVGASAYIVKSSFDQSNLLQVIDRLI